ncbi:hypothetical protein NN561_011333 [Cricetulus griseus]
MLPHRCQQCQLRPLPCLGAPTTATQRASGLRSPLPDCWVPPLPPCPPNSGRAGRGGGDSAFPVFPHTKDQADSADHLLEPLTHTPLPVCAAGVTDLLTVAAAPRSIFCPPPPPARFPSKSGGWRREKKKPVLKGAVRTDLSAAEEDPRSGRALQPVGTLERRARAEWQLRSARCPLGRSAPPPPSAQRSPPQRRGPGNPPARFFVQFQQSSEELGRECCQPRHVPSRENQLPRAVRLPPGSVAAASAQLRSPARGWGREPRWCARPGRRYSRNQIGESSHPRLVRSGPERPARSCVSTPLGLRERHRLACRVRARLGLAWEPTAWTSPSAPSCGCTGGVGC